MVTVKDGGAYYLGDGTFVQDDQEAGAKLALRGIKVTREEARNRTMAWQILSAHNKGTDPEKLARILGLPENEEILMVMDLGYAAEGAGPLPNHESRKPLEETVSHI